MKFEWFVPTSGTAVLKGLTPFDILPAHAVIRGKLLGNSAANLARPALKGHALFESKLCRLLPTSTYTQSTKIHTSSTKIRARIGP